MKGNAVWYRKQRGGMRRVTPLEVLVVGRTPAGCLVVEYERHERRVRRLVEPGCVASVAL